MRRMQAGGCPVIRARAGAGGCAASGAVPSAILTSPSPPSLGGPEMSKGHPRPLPPQCTNPPWLHMVEWGEKEQLGQRLSRLGLQCSGPSPWAKANLAGSGREDLAPPRPPQHKAQKARKDNCRLKALLLKKSEWSRGALANFKSGAKQPPA